MNMLKIKRVPIDLHAFSLTVKALAEIPDMCTHEFAHVVLVQQLEHLHQHCPVVAWWKEPHPGGDIHSSTVQ